MTKINLDDSQFMLLWSSINLVLESAHNSQSAPAVLKERLHDLVDDIFRQAYGYDYNSREHTDFPMCK